MTSRHTDWETVIGLEIHAELNTKSSFSAALPTALAMSPIPISPKCAQDSPAPCPSQ